MPCYTYPERKEGAKIAKFGSKRAHPFWPPYLSVSSSLQRDDPAEGEEGDAGRQDPARVERVVQVLLGVRDRVSHRRL